MFMHFQYTSGNIDISMFSHKRSVLISGPVDYLYVYIYSWECYGEHGQVSIQYSSAHLIQHVLSSGSTVKGVCWAGR